MAKKISNSMMAGGIVVLAIAVVLVAVLINQRASTPPAATTTVAPVGNLTTTSVAALTTTVVANQTVAIGPNLVNCNGFNYSTTRPGQIAVGFCSWRSGLMNITVFGGMFKSTTLTLVQQNVTTAPYNASYAGTGCVQKSNVFFVPAGNYKVSFSTGSPSPLIPCPPASFRLSH